MECECSISPPEQGDRIVTESEVKDRAFAMPLTSPAFPTGPYRFVDREFFIITYRTDPDALCAVIPAPLGAQGAIRHRKARLIGLAKVVAKEGGAHGVRANVICPGFVRTPLVDKQIPEQAKELGISEEEVVKKVMLKETVDGEFTTVEDVAEVALLFASFPSNALTGQSMVVSHGWFMQ
jgi:NAD(P)-dependent dehydrogenase (short-subunit alcohol dehydrogenase family)